MDGIAGIFLANLERYKECCWWQFYLSPRQYTSAPCIQHNPTLYNCYSAKL